MIIQHSAPHLQMKCRHRQTYHIYVLCGERTEICEEMTASHPFSVRTFLARVYWLAFFSVVFFVLFACWFSSSVLLALFHFIILIIDVLASNPVIYSEYGAHMELVELDNILF